MIYVKVFSCYNNELEDDVTGWLELMQSDEEEITILNTTQTQVGETITLTVFWQIAEVKE